jgi:hypothetical protein
MRSASLVRLRLLPGQLTRFMASVSGYQYAQSGSSVYVNYSQQDGRSFRLKKLANSRLCRKGTIPGMRHQPS